MTRARYMEQWKFSILVKKAQIWYKRMKQHWSSHDAILRAHWPQLDDLCERLKAEAKQIRTEEGELVALFLQILGTTPLHCAAYQGNLGVVELLVEEGAIIDSNVHLLGRTPLIAAIVAGHENIVRRLLELGASPTLKDTRKKRTPMQWAKRTGKREIAALLPAPRDLPKTQVPPAESSAPKGGSKYQVKVAPE